MRTPIGEVENSSQLAVNSSQLEVNCQPLTANPPAPNTFGTVGLRRSSLNSHLSTLLIVFFLLITSIGWGQVTIASDGLNNSTTLFTLTNGAYYTGTTSSTLDNPASASYAVEGTHSRGIANGTATLITGDINTNGYTSVQMSFRLASYSIGSTGNGADGTDIVTVSVSPDGGTTYYSTVRVLGNANARWSWSSGTGNASTAYDGNTTPVDFTPAGGGGRTTDGFSTVTVTGIPATSNLRIRVTMLNNDAAERWLLDDFKITGTAALSTDANLSALSLSSGTLSPAFSAGTTSYTASVANAVSSITVTPTRNQANATITVNGVTVTSGNASGNISLNVGDNTINVVVTAQDGSTKTYTVTVTRAAAAGANADLSALSLSSGTLSPTFAAATTSYTATVSNATSSITVTPTLADANATVSVRVNGGSYTSVNSGSASSSLALNVGSNTIDVRVTAQDGTTIKTYTITVTRQSNDATLSALTISAGTLSPSFTSGTTTYTASVSNATTSVTVTPIRNQANATIQVRVNGGSYTSVTSGSASGNLSLNVGSNTINVLVTAQDNSFTQTYTITVTRAASAVSTLSALIISSGTLSPTFASGTNAYTASVANATSSVTVTPTVTEANATIQVRVNGGAYSSVNSGSASGSLSLNEGSNTINVLVTAQDGTSTTTYTITVTRLLDYINLTALNTAVTEDFNTLASSGTSSTLPQGWHFNENGGDALYAADAGSATGGNTYSYGTGTANERALGSINTNAITPSYGAKIRNTTGSAINTISISFTGEQWRRGGSGNTDKLDFQYSTDATSLTSGTWSDLNTLDFSSLQTTATAASLDGNNAANRTSLSGTITGFSISNNNNIWIRWVDNNITGNDDGMAIDDFSITASVSATAPTLTAAANATVDGPFTITFSDNSAWRTAISSITVGGTTLDASAYSRSAGQITFTPSASALLQSSGDKSIAVLATGYTNATVTQTIGAGAATQLVVTTQPAAPATNGGSLATQPIVAIRDQYNNTLTGSSASVTAAVGSSGTWTLGGTKTINASSGVATFSGLTASNSTSVTGASILFTSGALSVTSSSFNIPAPPPANNTCGSATSLTLNAAAVSGTLAGATITAPFTGSQNDVWYQFVPTCNGTHTITVTGYGANEDPDIELYAGNLGTNCPTSSAMVTSNLVASSATADPSEVITGALTSGTTYYLRVLDFDGSAANSNFTVAVTQTNCAFPVPVATAATNVYSNGFQANWNAVTGASSYKLDVYTVPAATDLIISEYVEGSSNNKYIEIYNGTGASVNLSNYTLRIFTNGSASATEVSLSGTLENGATIVYANPQATIYNGTTTSNSSITSYNGDDAIGLFKVSTNSYVDIFGRIGNDPGAAWKSGTLTTENKTLRRKPTVTSGVTTSPTGTGTGAFTTLATEWDQFDIDVVSGLGSHSTVAYVSGYENITVNDTKRIVSGLSQGVGYRYVVRAVGTSTSANSNVISVTTTAAGPLPNIWVGGANGSWNNAANWSYGTIPATTGNTLIDDGTPLLDIDFTLAATGILTLSDNGSLVISAGKTLTIAGSADFGGRPITLKSTSTGTAAIGQVTGALSGASAVTVERYMPAQRRWRMLTAPLTGSTNNSIYYNWQNNNSASGSTGAIFWGPAATNGLYPSATGTGYNILRFNPATGNQGAWENVTSTTAAGSLFDANTNKPYIAFITGPYNTTGNYISGSPAATTLSATGTLRTGQVQFTGLNGGVGSDVRFHMIGNPYASAVTFSAITTSGTSGFFYVWDPKVGTLGAYSAIPSNSATVLESGQAFLVGVPSGNTGSVTFDEADKSSTTNNVMFRAQNTNPRATMKLYKSVNNNLTLFDQAWVDYQPDANAEIDGNDAPKPSNFTENLSIFRFGRDLMVERRPLFTQNDTIQLRLWRTQQTNYQIELNMENFSLPAGSIAVLEDRYLNTSTPIVLSGQQTINFSVNADPASSGERFRIVFRSNVVTPVSDVTASKGYRIYPNPVSASGNIQVEFRNKPAGTYTVSIMNLAGQRVHQAIVGHAGGSAVRTIGLNGNIPTGVYVAELVGAGETEKIMLTFE